MHQTSGEDEFELDYRVAFRAERAEPRLPKRYSPRFEKQRAPAGARGGIQFRSSRAASAGSVA